MIIDIFTMTLATAIVVTISGVVFLTETLLRHDTGAGRIWTLAFLAGVLTTLCYFIWSIDAGAWVAVGVGNGALVASAGCFWLGCRSFNGRAMLASQVAVSVGSLAAVGAVLIAGPDGGDWAGAVVMFVFIAVFAGLGAVESRRGSIGPLLTSIGLTVVLAIESLFYIARTVFFLSEGEDGPIFSGWLGSEMTGVITMVLTIVAVVTTSVLRAGHASLRGQRDTTALALANDGVLRGPSFDLLMQQVLDRAFVTGDLAGVIALSLDDLPRIGAAFGSAEQEDFTIAWREGVRRYAPNLAFVGESGPTTLLVGVQPTSVGDARRIASRIHRRVLDDFAEMRSAVIPVVGVGVALSTPTGYQLPALVAAAKDAALVSASSSDASVMISGV